MASGAGNTDNTVPELELPIIDAHMHVLPPRRLAGLLRWVHGFMPTHPVPKDITADGVIQDSKNFGTKYFFNQIYPINPLETESLNNFNFELTERMPNCVGWGSAHLENSDRAGIAERALDDQGFIGLKFHPMVQNFSILDSRILPVYEVLAERKRPLFIHTGFDDFYEIKMPPAHIGKIAADYPDMPIVISHLVFPRLAEAFELMDEFPGIIGDLTNVPGCVRMIAAGNGGDIKSTDACRVLHKELPKFADRIIFGSDHPAGVGGYADIYRDLLALELAPEIIRAATWDNPLKMVSDFLPGKWPDAMCHAENLIQRCRG